MPDALDDLLLSGGVIPPNVFIGEKALHDRVRALMQDDAQANRSSVPSSSELRDALVVRAVQSHRIAAKSLFRLLAEQV
jgi:hypothetical protein